MFERMIGTDSRTSAIQIGPSVSGVLRCRRMVCRIICLSVAFYSGCDIIFHRLFVADHFGSTLAASISNAAPKYRRACASHSSLPRAMPPVSAAT